jgi:hypothetical protein
MDRNCSLKMRVRLMVGIMLSRRERFIAMMQRLLDLEVKAPRLSCRVNTSRFVHLSM